MSSLGGICEVDFPSFTSDVACLMRRCLPAVVGLEYRLRLGISGDDIHEGPDGVVVVVLVLSPGCILSF